jgi:hypothetical protein
MTKCLSFGVNDNDEIDVSKGDNPCGNNCDDLRDKEKRRQRKKKTKQETNKNKNKTGLGDVNTVVQVPLCPPNRTFSCCR